MVVIRCLQVFRYGFALIGNLGLLHSEPPHYRLSRAIKILDVEISIVENPNDLINDLLHSIDVRGVYPRPNMSDDLYFETSDRSLSCRLRLIRQYLDFNDVQN